MIAESKIAESSAGQPLTDSHQPPAISWEEFETAYLTREDEYKYEWVRGQVVKTERELSQSYYFIYDNILAFSRKCSNTSNYPGEFYVAIDTFFLKNAHRRPDMAWFSNEQAARMAHGQNQVPAFVIEIISKNDIADDLLDKLDDYSEAGVKVIWLISPALEQVHVFAEGKKAICKGDMPCSADPVLPNLQITANELFRKPALPSE
jgi:Uma2 family endonuclease